MSKIPTIISGQKNVLKGTKCVVIGHMQYGDGAKVREDIANKLSSLNITVWDHYKKPFMCELDESPEIHKQLNKWVETGEYDRVTDYSPIRIYDLALIDKSDFIIFVFDPDVMTCGSWEEFFTGNKIKRPIFFVNIKGKNKTPLWVFWTLKNHHYIYGSIENCIETIYKIDSGEIPLDSDRWRLFKPECR
jgi:hypothetical protein